MPTSGSTNPEERLQPNESGSKGQASGADPGARKAPKRAHDAESKEMDWDLDDPGFHPEPRPAPGPKMPGWFWAPAARPRKERAAFSMEWSVPSDSALSPGQVAARLAGLDLRSLCLDPANAQIEPWLSALVACGVTVPIIRFSTLSAELVPSPTLARLAAHGTQRIIVGSGTVTEGARGPTPRERGRAFEALDSLARRAHRAGVAMTVAPSLGTVLGSVGAAAGFIRHRWGRHDGLAVTISDLVDPGDPAAVLDAVEARVWLYLNRNEPKGPVFRFSLSVWAGGNLHPKAWVS